MTRLTIVAAIGVLSATIPLPAAAGSEPAGHRHDTENFSAGEPGDPEKPSRAIKVIMQEHDGKMLFAPNHVEIQKGEQIKFELYNSGELDHEFVLATCPREPKARGSDEDEPRDGTPRSECDACPTEENRRDRLELHKVR